MTYCVGVLLDEGLVFGSDSRTHAGVDNFAKFCKVSTFEREGDRVIVMVSSGNLAGTQAVVSTLKQRAEMVSERPNMWTARTMFDCVNLIADAMRDIGRRDRPHLEQGGVSFDASFIVGGQIRGEAPRLFRIYAEGNFIEAGRETPFLQTGDAKYGKPIIDRVIVPSTSLALATKCVLVSFDSTMRSNLSVGMPIDLICYEADALKITHRHRFDQGDPQFARLSKEWSEGVRSLLRGLPDIEW